MAVPAKKTSKSKKNHRRSHDSIKAPNLAICPQCNEPKRPHHICQKCGYYKGREVITIESE